MPPVAGFIGRDRAAEIAINAALPLLYALGRFWENRALEDAKSRGIPNVSQPYLERSRPRYG